jgi:hypothetical protein
MISGILLLIISLKLNVIAFASVFSGDSSYYRVTRYLTYARPAVNSYHNAFHCWFVGIGSSLRKRAHIST